MGEKFELEMLLSAQSSGTSQTEVIASILLLDPALPCFPGDSCLSRHCAASLRPGSFHLPFLPSSTHYKELGHLQEIKDPRAYSKQLMNSAPPTKPKPGQLYSLL